MNSNVVSLLCVLGLWFVICLCQRAAAESELDIVILEKPEECERQSANGDFLSIHYTGKLASDGTVFDSSVGKQPFQFQVGRQQVISGWDQGTLDMCVGEKRTLNIPSHLGYGAQGAGDRIPAHADLVFDIELINIGEAPPQANVFRQIDNDKDGQLSRKEVVDYLVKQIPPNMNEDDMGKFDQSTMVEEIFQHEDKDKNGFISHDEFSGPKIDHDEL